MLDETCPTAGASCSGKFGRFGPFVGCFPYPECRYIKKDPPKSTGETCPVQAGRDRREADPVRSDVRVRALPGLRLRGQPPADADRSRPSATSLLIRRPKSLRCWGCASSMTRSTSPSPAIRWPRPRRGRRRRRHARLRGGQAGGEEEDRRQAHRRQAHRRQAHDDQTNRREALHDQADPRRSGRRPRRRRLRRRR